jgi:hypothetical protein
MYVTNPLAVEGADDEDALDPVQLTEEEGRAHGAGAAGRRHVLARQIAREGPEKGSEKGPEKEPEET